LYRREMLLKVGGMNLAMWTAEEYELHIRLLKEGYKLGYVDAFVHRNRIHAHSKSRPQDAMLKMQRIQFIEVMKARYH